MRAGGARRLLRATLCAAAACGTLGVKAQPRASPSGDELPELNYVATPGCPGRAEFLERVRARRRNAPSPGVGPQRLEVELRALRGRAEGAIAIVSSSGARAQRRIEAASCTEAGDALALIAALAIEGTAANDAAASGAPTSAASPDATTGPDARSTGGAQSPTPPKQSGSTAAREDDTAQPSGPPPQPTAPEGDDDVARDEAGDSQSQAEAGRSEEPGAAPAEVRIVLLGSGLLAAGVQPELQPGLALSALVARVAEGAPELALRAGVRLSAEHAGEYAQGAAAFAWWSGTLALCAGARAPVAALALRGCAAFELGRLAADASATLRPHDAGRLWAAAGPAAMLEWDALPPLGLQAGIEALFPLVRDRFLLGGETVHRAPALGFRAEIGVGVRVW